VSPIAFLENSKPSVFNIKEKVLSLLQTAHCPQGESFLFLACQSDKSGCLRILGKLDREVKSFLTCQIFPSV